jgi:metallo-beta-lactamase class B
MEGEMAYEGAKLAAAITAATLMTGAALAQAGPDAAGLYEHVMKARAAAGLDLRHHFYHRCFVDPNYSATIADQRKMTAAMDPVQVFDQLYFVGQNAVSSWVLKTSAGLILFDTQNNPDEAKQFVEGGMAKLGLDPNQIRYIVIMHEHADHYGGAKYLKSRYPSARIVASPAGWDAMAHDTGRGAPYIPAHDMDVGDGQKLTLGDTTVTFYHTPGHAPGTISAIFRVTDHGVPHVVGFFGGMGSPRTEANRDTLIGSFTRWQGIARAAGVDTLIANHQGQDYSVENLEFIKVRHASDPNPYVIGRDAYQRYFTVQSECTKVALARNGQAIPR